MSSYEFISDCNNTIFNFLKYNCGVSSRLLRKFKNEGKISINKAPASINSFVNPNDHIAIQIDESLGDTIPENIPIDIVFEDESILVINKPPNMILHPVCSHRAGTLANAVAFHFARNKINTPIRPVIRLDKDTSGIVIFAKNAYIQETIIKQMKSGKVEKIYMAFVEGTPEPAAGRISAPISRLPGSIITRQVSHDGEYAATNYKVITEFDGYSLLEIRPETGRTHQIRVHMQYIGHPILGDTLYGLESKLIGRQALHAFRYKFIHPIEKNEVNLTAPLPNDFNSLIKKTFINEIQIPNPVDKPI
ncbi:MAG: RluA family pseudouridine synthase [Ignavibacteriales bacterium]